MKYPAKMRVAALLLAGVACAGGALAQSGKQVLRDTEPLPPEDRASTGAIVLPDEPVLAQREYLTRLAQERSPTSVMGAGPATSVMGGPPSPTSVMGAPGIAVACDKAAAAATEAERRAELLDCQRRSNQILGR